ncbi:MAG TPA: hypothetical protein VLC09_20380 [Polyangiaceae bacterium]|nr:hypothetical protein [Polyangiaceae bacterium]
MARDGLTRREIGWLLAQEARSAARALRRGMETKVRESLLPPPASGARTVLGGTPAAPSGTPEAPWLDGLNALDDAIGMLGDLQTHTGPRWRGRIDVASLLYELAPHATITLATEGGSEVLAEQDELTRMLQLLLGTAGYGPQAEQSTLDVNIERTGDEIRIRTELGPDAAPLDGLERRWLHRMATRFGGRVEVSGRAQTLILPAEGQHDRHHRDMSDSHEPEEHVARTLSGVLGQAGSLGVGDPSENDRFAELNALAGPLAASLERGGAGDSNLALTLAALVAPVSLVLTPFVVDELLVPLAAGLDVQLLVLQRGATFDGSAGTVARWVELAGRAALEVTRASTRPTLTFAARAHELELSLTCELPDDAGTQVPESFAWYAARAWAERVGARTGASSESGPPGKRLLLWVRFAEQR